MIAVFTAGRKGMTFLKSFTCDYQTLCVGLNTVRHVYYRLSSGKKNFLFLGKKRQLYCYCKKINKKKTQLIEDGAFMPCDDSKAQQEEDSSFFLVMIQPIKEPQTLS